MHTDRSSMNRTTKKTRSFCSMPVRQSIVVIALASAAASNAWAAGPLPNGGKFVAGAGQIASNGAQMTITQTTSRGVVDWCSFSIDTRHSVNVQNGTGATLSRVTGTEQSLIQGSLSASGSFYLINPQGVVIGANGVVTTGGRFVASTLDVSNDAFMAGGALTFAGSGAGMVVNLGKISSTSGDVLLIARQLVENDGTVSAPAGSAELAAGDQVLVRDSTGMPQTFVQTSGSRGDVVDKGTIAAAQIALQAADGNVYALAAHTDALRATGTATRDGHVWLVANNGTAHVHGRIDAKNVDGSGGIVDTTGATLHLDDADIHARDWNLNAPLFNVGPKTTAALLAQLNRGTSLTLDASQGDIVMEQPLRWSGNASLTLNAAHSVTVGAIATLANAGAGNLTLRADAAGANNGGSIVNLGMIDWSKSLGLVSSYRDRNGQFVSGQTLSNPAWGAPQYSGIRAQITNYVLINSLGDLAGISQDLNGSYALGRDIDASATNGTFQSIGSGSANGFTGQLDGLGHTIENLSIALQDVNGEQPTGLFATIGDSGVVRNMKLANVNMSVYYSPNAPLAQRSSGLVSYVHADGIVQTQGSTSLPFGGLIAINSGVVYRSDSAASVGASALVGGLVGSNSGTILQSFATGSVGGGSRSAGGGLVGDNSGTIRQSYSTASVRAGSSNGGLVSSNTGSIEESFASGPVDTFILPMYRGGVVADNAGTVASNVFWDRQSTGQTAGYGSGNPISAANGLTTGQMSTPSSFGPTWDFGAGGTWVMLHNATHPILRWQVTQ